MKTNKKLLWFNEDCNLYIDKDGNYHGKVDMELLEMQYQLQLEQNKKRKHWEEFHQ